MMLGKTVLGVSALVVVGLSLQSYASPKSSSLRLAQAPTASTEAGTAHSCLGWPPEELPPCLPDNIPFPDDFSLIVSEGLASQGEYKVQGEVPEDIGEIQNFYYQRSEALGWDEFSYDKEVDNDLLRLGFIQGDVIYVVTLTAIDNGTRITLETSRHSGRSQ